MMPSRRNRKLGRNLMIWLAAIAALALVASFQAGPAQSQREIAWPAVVKPIVLLLLFSSVLTYGVWRRRLRWGSVTLLVGALTLAVGAAALHWLGLLH